MKAIIFSVSAGAGHARAAEAVKKHIELNNPDSEVIIIDTLRYINPIIDKVVIGSYLKSLKISPSIFGKLYDYTESDYGLALISAKFNEIMTFKLMPLINDFDPDIMIATHPFPTEMLSILKVKHKTEVPIVSILTDYAPHSFWIHPCIDAYIVSNSDMIDEISSKGIPKDIIYDLGIPVNPEFLVKYDKKETLREIGLSPNVKTLLIMGGSLGLGKIEEVFEDILQVDEHLQIIVITGNNKKLYNDLMKYNNTIIGNKKTHIIGFTDKVNKYMQASDLLLTKPGGLTITEALICNLPMALFSPIPGQEEKNAEFLLKNNLAVYLREDNVAYIIEGLMRQENRLKQMKENIKNFSKPKAGKGLSLLLKTLIKKNETEELSIM
ncbi:UDP-N-acetylglucosamine--LPS N-acetylglucosamine transferase [Clostridium sp. MSJ-11]|uniref:UDP-N-acetylglucosamine--LPS N-acetylglucosamine transferase n=1 Tax=Clostridium mobile TaxID=2841512 RepID=A0ABS6EM86_9CLOT|nr:glycosyltransferase [Clostridium mobile]MBU5486148.1 UDP-N-acetylglucosamine--LPS N-acetylglucosamine transferase [Clostridium mobile]